MKLMLTKHFQERLNERGLLSTDAFSNAIKEMQILAQSKMNLVAASKKVTNSSEELYVYKHRSLNIIFTIKGDSAILLTIEDQKLMA